MLTVRVGDMILLYHAGDKVKSKFDDKAIYLEIMVKPYGNKRS
jgi:hypothetical protein